MARQIWLLRHAEAEPHGTRADAQRRLTDRGERQASAAGAALAALGVQFELILYSPKVRAARTAELATGGWSEEARAAMSVHPPLAGGFDSALAIDALSAVGPDGRVLLVGHEPDLSQLVADLTGARIDLKKGGVAVVRLEGARGELLALMRPRELALIAGLPAGRE